MTHWFRNIWEEVARPLLLRPRRVQFAALCTRRAEGGPEVLLITSRDTGRWVIPKGWPIDGLDGAQTAAQEAWEEAGVQAETVEKEPLGHYNYDKVLKDGSAQPVLTTVYHIATRELAEDFPEIDQRTRQWFSPATASTLVAEPELQSLLAKCNEIAKI